MADEIVTPGLSVDAILAECLQNPASYYHGTASRFLLTAWDGNVLNEDKIIQAKFFLDKLVVLLQPAVPES